MSKWAVVSGSDGWMHVVPCDDNEVILPPHEYSVNCVCGPIEDAECPNTILVHQDPERGGYNA